jgi:sulfite exporter TauE/SafE/copper chaperone CopZ
MTCRSCEFRIQRQVGRIPNVQRVTASALRGRVVIESSAPIAARAIAKAINAAGYEVGKTPWLERNPRAWLDAGSGLVLLAAIAILAQMTGLTALASGTGDLSSGGLVVALLLGLAAGVSTCMALVGGLLLALSASFQTRQAASAQSGTGVAAQMRPALVFMAGRIAGYGVLGAALGAVGASVTMPPRVTAVLMIAVAAVMIILGTRLTGLSPRIASWSPTLPMGIGKGLGLHGGAGGGYSDGRAAGLGAASFFLPCGFTQAVQIYALSTGSPLFAGALMAVFAIGTAPGLLALAGLPVVVPSSMKPGLLRLVGVVVLGFALLNGSAGLRLAGISLSLPELAPVAAAAPPAGATAPDGAQVLTTHQDGGGYSPGNVSIYAGTPTHWIIKSSTTATCAASLVVSDLNLQVRLHVGDNAIELPALPKGTLDYSCAMGMYSGRITIVDRGTTAGG